MYEQRQIETQASIVLSGLRNAESKLFSSSSSTLTNYSSHLPFDQDYIPGEPLILPDKSILEEYVHRKRSELERLYSEPLRSPSRGAAGSPCLSTTSELVPACAVRIIEPRNRGAGIAFISAPNRATADSIESHSLPTSKRNSKMIEVISYPQNFDQSNNNNNNVGWRSALRKPVAKREALTIQHFDAPKTPFEAAMQNQAAQMAKKSSVASNLSALSEGDAQKPSLYLQKHADTSSAEPLPLDFQQHRRRPSIESTQSMPPIATGTVGQSFAQAAALASQPRHERYAAHIPVRQTSTEPSGRQSTTSIDSANR
uniref:Uncharacterized protein n=1 Tax=Panagrolaimus superbus TaxID=310955 RepID=A0A914YZA9_9BILA